MRGAIGQNAVVASEAFTLKYGVQAGDEVGCQHPPARPIRLAAVTTTTRTTAAS